MNSIGSKFIGISKSSFAYVSAIVVAILLMTACEAAPPSDASPVAQATIDALVAEVDTLRVEVAALQNDGTVAGDATDGEPVQIAAAPEVQADSNSAETESSLAAEAQPSSPLPEPADAVEEPTAMPTETPTPPPPPTPLPTFVPAPLDGDPPADRYRPAGRIGEFWVADAPRQQSLGWALEETLQPVDGVMQEFEHGIMLWRSDTGQIIALWTEDGQRHWRALDDIFEEGEMEKDPTIAAPGGLRQPERGFGKIWRTYPDMRENLGWALAREQETVARIQAFERGLVTEIGLDTYALGQTPEGVTVWDVQ